MYKVIREIRLFFAQHGKLLFQILGTIVIIFLIIQGANKGAKEEYNIKKEREEYYKEMKENEEKRLIETKFISEFISYCNEQNTYLAYKMISDNLKDENFKTINEFKNEFINTYFSEEKDFKVKKYNEDIYEIELFKNLLENGKKLEKKYIKIKIHSEGENIKIIELGENI